MQIIAVLFPHWLMSDLSLSWLATAKMLDTNEVSRKEWLLTAVQF